MLIPTPDVVKESPSAVLRKPRTIRTRRRIQVSCYMAYGETPSLIPGFKTVSLSDFIMQPGSKSGTMPMMCENQHSSCRTLSGERLLSSP